METQKKVQLGKHSISYGKTTKTFMDKAGAGIAKMLIRLAILYFIWYQLYFLYGFELTFIILCFFVSCNLGDGIGEIKKIRELLEKEKEVEKEKPDEPDEDKKPIWKE